VPSVELAVEEVGVVYGAGAAAVRALANVTLSFYPGTVTLIVGPSGSGKTSLLCVLGCLLTPQVGQIFVLGQEVRTLSDGRKTALRQRHIGFVFQAFRLFKSLSALENVLIAKEIVGSCSNEDKEVAQQRLCDLGLEGKLSLKPSALSGGEKQRVAIARALVTNPSIILADEPTASLDSAAGHKVGEILRNLAEVENRVVVIVSHDLRLTRFAHRVVEMSDGEVVRTSSVP
jgi:putative ABC transport system ATP-binding protein